MNRSQLCRHQYPPQSSSVLFMTGFLAFSLALETAAWAGVKPVDVRFYGHMCADVPYTVTVNGVTKDGEGEDCGYYANTEWGTTKLIPEQIYSASTTGALCSTHIPFEVKGCYKLFVKGDPYSDWTEVTQIDKNQTYSGDTPNKDAGGSWQIVLTDKDSPQFGSGSTQLGSVYVGMSLGSLGSGSPAGKLILEAEEITAATYTPGALRVAKFSDDVEVILSSGDVRQIYTWDGLVDIVTVTGGFEARFYSLADVGSIGGGGLYTITSSATALVTWSFINPDSSATTRLKVTETRSGLPLAFTIYAHEGNNWTLEQGTGTQLQSTIVKSIDTIGGQPVEVVTERRYASPTVYETTITRTYTAAADPHLADQHQSTEYPDGRKDTFTYETGAYVAGTRTFTPGTGNFIRETVTHGISQSPGNIAGKSTRDVTVTDPQGLSLLEEFYAYDGSGFSQITQTWHTYDGEGHLTESNRDGQVIYSAVWYWGNKVSETDETGVTTEFGDYDYQNRPHSLTKIGVEADGGYPAQPNIQTWRDYDYYTGAILSETVSAGEFTTYSETRYLYDGKIDYTIQNEFLTDYSYDTSGSGGQITTITFPGGTTEIREEDSDGRLKSVTGSAVIPEYYTYGSDTNGNEWRQVNYGSISSSNYVKTTTDWMGRVIKEERPAYTGLFVKQFFFNEKGQLWREATTGLADRLNVYDAMGNLFRTGLDMDGNGSLDAASTDRIEETDTIYELDGGNWYRSVVRRSYLTDNDDTATVSSDKMRLDLPSGTLQEVISSDVGDNPTIIATLVDRSNKLVTQTVQVPGSDTTAERVIRNGLLQSESSNTVETPMLFTRDGLGRLTGITDPRTETSTTITYEDGEYASDRIESVTAGDQVTVQSYYSPEESAPGFLKSRTVNGGTTRFDYNSRGQLEHTWGDATYPTWMEYDDYGLPWKLHTYQNEAGWSDATWPSAGSGNVTTWNRQESTGLVTSKTDASDESVTFTYKPFGQVETRTWARDISTTYSYNQAGEPSGIDYSDSTPDIILEYNRAGRPKTIFDASGRRTLLYNATGSLASDNVRGGTQYGGIGIDVGYDGLLRRNGFTAARNGTVLASVTYGYDDVSRLETVSSGAQNATYGYHADSDLVHTITFKQSSTTAMTLTKTYDSFNRLSSISSAPTTGSPVSYEYGFNAAGLRDQITLENDDYWEFGYNARNEVTSGSKKQTGGTNLLGYQFGYSFDAIGNRLTATVNSRTSTYTPNAVNEYDSRTVPGYVNVIGTANTTAAVTVNGSAAIRQGKAYHKELSGDNTASSVYLATSVIATLGGETSEIEGHLYVPETPESFDHDEDGNLLEDGRWNYAWDGENRLIGMETTTEAAAAGVPKQRLMFSYDYLSRRISKKAEHWNGSAYQEHHTMLFVYDGWNLVAEVLAAGPKIRSYVWGSDLSGTRQEAGGVGGLLFVNQYPENKSYSVGYDGNGNVTALFDTAAPGAMAAYYEYGPFGEVLVESGPYAEVNPFTFSTNYTEDESDLVYGKGRWYQPLLGRWLNRDPFEELGGVNLYAFVENDPVNQVDPFGLWKLGKESRGQSLAEYEAEKNDNILGLAALRGLKSSDYKKWLTLGTGEMPSSETEKLCGTYKVPNTVIAYWAGAGGFLGRLYTGWRGGIGRLRSMGYKIEEYHYKAPRLEKRSWYRSDGTFGGNTLVMIGGSPSGDLQAKLTASGQAKRLHGLYFWGHGGEEGLYSDHGNYFGPQRMLVRYETMRVPYGLGLLWVYACYSGCAQPAMGSGAPGMDVRGAATGTLIPLPFGFYIDTGR